MMHAMSPNPPRENRSVPAAWFGWLLPIGFGCVALVLFVSSRQTDIPIPLPGAVDRASLTVGPVRIAMSDPAHMQVEGRPQSCTGCHQIFNSSHPAGAALSYHRDIRLSHGLNDRCVNCHDADHRDRLALRDGSTVSYADTPQLCAQCHGTVYRDWQRGTHGKTLGSWVTHSQAQHRLSCNECHDPHSPRYQPYTPLPGPNTLRMGDQVEPLHPTPTDGENPLQRMHSGLHGVPPQQTPGDGADS
jgi:hypothetical protein